MTSERLEVVEGPSGWIVSDQRTAPTLYPSATEALGAAMKQGERMAKAGTSVEVHLWKHGKDTVVRFSAQ